MTRSVVLFVAVLSLSLAAQARPSKDYPIEGSSTPTRKDAEAESIAERSLMSMGRNKVKNGQTASVTGVITLHGSSPQDFSVVITSRGTREIRTEIKTPNGPRIFIVNDRHGVIRDANGKIRWLSDRNMATQRVSHIPALSLLAEHADPDTNVDYAKQSTVDGKVVDVIAIEPFNGQQKDKDPSKHPHMLVSVDRDSGLVLRTEGLNYSENLQDESKPIEIRYSDYRSVNGVMVPFRQQTLLDGSLWQDFVITDVKFDVVVSDSDFDLSR